MLSLAGLIPDCMEYLCFTLLTRRNDQRSRIKPLPASLNEALSALAVDHAFLTEGGVFSEEMLQQWVDYKRQAEYFAVRNRPHPYEMSLYFDV